VSVASGPDICLSKCSRAWESTRCRLRSVGEAQVLTGQAIESRRFMKRAAVASQVSPPQIVSEDEDNVRSLHGSPDRDGSSDETTALGCWTR